MPVPPARADLVRLATERSRQHQARGHRHLLVLSGEARWCRDMATAIVDDLPRAWIGGDAGDDGPCLPQSKARLLLGGEWDRLVFDAHAGFDVDAFAAATGTLRGGGLLLLLAPPLTGWSACPDPALGTLLSSPARPADAAGRFVTRFVRLMHGDPAVDICTPDRCPTPSPTRPLPPVTTERPPGWTTADQERAIEAVCEALTGRPAVLTADRGRGKSAALGLAAARLLATRPYRIVATAPRRTAVASLFRHAAAGLGIAWTRGDLHLPSGGELRFVAPDRLLQGRHVADLLLVDEAAAIPAPLLEALLRRDRRIAFATTVHGYEGTGRGFALRFGQTLDRLAPSWQDVVLRTPIRWADDDPLEAWLGRALLLEAEPAPTTGTDGEPTCGRLEIDVLAQDEPLLRHLFGLLVQAHYRTTPRDLRLLLDVPGIGLHVARIGGTPVGVAVTVPEGRLDPADAFAVWAGRRRLRGHLVPQSLAGHAGLRGAPELGYRRVQRIAVDPAFRGRGVGRALLEDVAAEASAAGDDLVATSFGMTPDLAAFWQACGFRAARIGLKREASSGAHALMMLRPLTAAGEALAATAARRLGDARPVLDERVLHAIEPTLREALARALPPSRTSPSPGPEDWEEAAAFAFGARGPDAAWSALRRVVLALGDHPGALPDPLRAALVARFVDGESWDGIADRLGCAGRRGAVARLREALRPALTARRDPALAALVGKLKAIASGAGSA